MGAERVREHLPPLLRAVARRGAPGPLGLRPDARERHPHRRRRARRATSTRSWARSRASSPPAGTSASGRAACISSSRARTSPSASAARRTCSRSTSTRATRRCCDPRLNARQSLDLAFRLAELMRQAAPRERDVERLAVVGTGLIGASVGLAARARGDARASAGIPTRLRSPRAGAREARRRRRARSRRPSRDAELAVVAAPIAALPATGRRRCSQPPATTTVTDVGSTKASVVAAAAGSPRFVGGHPIAAPRRAAPSTRRAGLFEGATWFLTPVARDRPRAPPRSCTASSPTSARSRSRSTPAPTTASSR